jgi:aryl-alcohol dehydrogenase-like predicted oxidoreductase
MKTRRLGRDGPKVSAIALGCMRMARFAKPLDVQTDAEAIATIQEAIDAGISILNTGDFYGMGHSEALVGHAIKGRREQVFLSVKFGAMIAPGFRMLGHDGRPNSVKNFISYSLQRLGVDAIDLYQVGRPDTHVPYEETIGAISDLIREGKVRYLGVSEVGVEQLRRAHSVHPVTALEIEYSLACRFIEPKILPVARELGIAVAPYRVFGDGLLTGAVSVDPASKEQPFTAPRLQGENRRRNIETVSVFLEIAASKGVAPGTLAIAWLLSRGEDIVPIVGINRRSRLREALAAVNMVLTTAEVIALDQALPLGAIVGDRFPSPIQQISAS